MAENVNTRLPSSDRLAIVLACLGALVAVILYVLDHVWVKNPLLIAGGALTAIVSLAIYPITHFTSSLAARIRRVAEVTLFTCLSLCLLWPNIKEDSASGAEKTPTESVAAPVDGLHCASETIKSTFSTYNHRIKAHFTYSTDYNQTALGEGLSTPPQTIAPHSYIKQDIDGLSENTTYYYKLVVDGQAAETDVKSFETKPCEFYQTGG